MTRVQALEAGSCLEVRRHVNIAELSRLGELTADALQEIPESIESNNSLSYPRRQESHYDPPAPLPDLYVAGVISRPSPPKGEGISLTIRVGNAGSRRSGASHLFVWLGSELPGSLQDRPIDNYLVAVPSLAAGDVASLEYDILIPWEVGGSIIIVLDPGNEIAEEDEGNNAFLWQ